MLYSIAILKRIKTEDSELKDTHNLVIFDESIIS